MAVTLGHIEEFSPQIDNIITYLERMEVFFMANDAKQPAVLLSCIGSKTYSIVKNLLAPALLSSKSYAELKATLNSHFVPKYSYSTADSNIEENP